MAILAQKALDVPGIGGGPGPEHLEKGWPVVMVAQDEMNRQRCRIGHVLQQRVFLDRAGVDQIAGQHDESRIGVVGGNRGHRGAGARDSIDRPVRFAGQVDIAHHDEFQGHG